MEICEGEDLVEGSEFTTQVKLVGLTHPGRGVKTV